MKNVRWFPRPVAWVSALLLFAFSTGFGAALAIVLPLLFELARLSPRLAWLGILCAWLSPIALVGSAHRVGHAVLDALDDQPPDGHEQSAGRSVWAGVFAWLVLTLTSITTVLVMLVVNPPPPPEPESFALLAERFAAAAPSLSLRGVVWIVVAAALYHAERGARRRAP